MANDIPNFRSYPQTLGEMTEALVSRFGLKNLKVGSAILSTMEAAAQSDVRTSQDIFNLLASRALDRSEGIALDRIGADEDILRLEAEESNGKVVITDESFEKISSRVFQGTSPPIVGSVLININAVDAALFTTSGNIYIGRGTLNFEGPIAYSSKTDNGTYVTLNLSTPTTKFHNVAEEVVLGQGGDRTITAGTVVRTPQINNASVVEFRTTYTSVLPDGENQIEDVLVSCSVPGLDGNVISGSIIEFATTPFPGAAVTNPLPFTNGLASEDDITYRERIKSTRATRQKGTDLAIVTSISNIISPDENRRVTSSSIVATTDVASTLFIDDGSGYEEQTDGVGFEAIIDAAGGGERFLQATNRPIAKAFVVSQKEAPYILEEAAQLAVKVGGVLRVHTFRSSDFVSIQNASAYEVSSSINGNPDIDFGARTLNGGKNVVLFSRNESNDDVELVPVLEPNIDANLEIRFAANRHFTTLLYKNDRILNKDGTAAIILSRDFDGWSIISGSQTLGIAVDGTPSAVYTITDQDFFDLNTGYAAVGNNSLEAWATVLNARIPGITVTVANDQLVVTSNKGFVASASIVIDPVTTSLVGKIFDQVQAFGTDKDYVLDRNVSQFRLSKILSLGDKLTLGTEWTRSFIESPSIDPVALLNDVRMWMAVDSNATPVAHKFGARYTFEIEKFQAWGLRVHMTATLANQPFKSVKPGDFLILWDESFNDTQRQVWRVSEVDPEFNYVVLVKKNMNLARSSREAVALTSGEVISIGGITSPSLEFASENSVTATAELWNNITGEWTFAASMSTSRKNFAAARLSNGKVLVAGGEDQNGVLLNSIEIYDPTLDSWSISPVSLTIPVSRLTVNLLSDNRVFIAGGMDSNGLAVVNCYVLAPDGLSLLSSPSFGVGRGRHSHRAVLVGTSIFVVGGMDSGGSLSSKTDSFDGTVFTIRANMDVGRAVFGLERVDSNRLLAVGNSSEYSIGNFDTYTTYNISGNAWEPSEPARVSFDHPAKKPVKAATTANIVLAAPQVIDTVSVVAGDRVLVKNQITLSQNGVYLVAAGAWTRVVDLNSAAEFYLKPTFYVKNGTQAGTSWHTNQEEVDITSGGGVGSATITFTETTEIKTFSVVDSKILKMVDASSVNVENIVALGKLDFLELVGTFSFMFDIANAGPAIRETWQFTGFFPEPNTPTWITDWNPVNVIGTPSGTRRVLFPNSYNVTSQESSAISHQLTQTGGNVAIGGSGTDLVNVNEILDPIVDTTGVILTAAGVTIVRSDNYVQQLTVPAGSYTAFNLSETLNETLKGALASTYLTDKTRIRTNSFDVDGDIALVAIEPEMKEAFGLEVDYFNNLTNHFGSTESGNSDVGTTNFEPTLINYTTDSGTLDWPITAFLNGVIDGGQKVNILNRLMNSDDLGLNWGLNEGFSSLVSLVEDYNADRGYYKVGLRSTFLHESMPNERISITNPFAIGPEDDLSVVIDKDVLTKRYPVNMFRKLTPTTSTYGSTNEFKDLDNSNQSLAVAFGLEYDFNDFAIYMKARTKSHEADATRSVLWRYYRFGAEGNNALVRYVYPDEADQQITARVVTPDKSTLVENNSRQKINVEIVLGSGAERTGNTFQPSNFNNSFFGQAIVLAPGPGVTVNYFFLGFTVESAERDGLNETTLTLTIPDATPSTGPSSTGLSPGDKLYLNSTDVNWTSGVITLTSVDPANLIAGTQDVRFTSTDVGVVAPTPNIGNVSFNSEGESLFDVALSDGDYVSSIGVTQFGDPIAKLRTYQVLSHGAQYLSAYVLDRGFNGNDPYTLGVLSRQTEWAPLTQDTSVVIFQNFGSSAKDIVDAVNGLANEEDSKVPIIGTVLGTGTGIITMSTWAETFDSQAGYFMSDGLNHVSKTTLPPNVALHYGFDFKMPITGSLSTDSDWANEEVRIVPIHAHTVRRWLNTPAISGLFNVSQVEESDSGNRVQISTLTAGSVGGVQVQGGTANNITANVFGTSLKYDVDNSSPNPILDGMVAIISKENATGLLGGAYVDINNTENILKPGIFMASSEISSITTDGVVEFYPGTVNLYNKICETNGDFSLLSFEREGDLVGITIIRNSSLPSVLQISSFISSFNGPTEVLKEGDWLRLVRNTVIIENEVIDTEFLMTPSANEGVFRVVRVTSGKYIEENFDFPKFFYAETVWIENPNAIEGTFFTNFEGYSSNSVMPGDTLSINTDLWGAGNKGSFKILEVGQDGTGFQFTNTTKIRLDISQRTTQQVLNASPGTLTLGASRVSLVNVYESSPAHFIKKIFGIYPNQEDGTKTDLFFDTSYSFGSISSALGSIITARDKLEFSTDTFSGIDAYRYNTGLVGEANKVVYGVPSDPDTYPGVAANGSQVNISGPIVKRIKVSLSVRARTGVPLNELGDRVRSAVATEINQSAVGQSISFSDLISAAGSVVGVISVSIISPNYNSINDLIRVQPFEKLLVLDLVNDISVTFVGQ